MNGVQKTLQWMSRRSLSQILLIGAALTGGYVLWGQYRQQMIAYLPYLIVLLCPLMHIFMHRGHGGHGSNDRDD